MGLNSKSHPSRHKLMSLKQYILEHYLCRPRDLISLTRGRLRPSAGHDARGGLRLSSNVFRQPEDTKVLNFI